MEIHLPIILSWSLHTPAKCESMNGKKASKCLLRSSSFLLQSQLAPKSYIDLFEEKCKIKMKKDFCGSKFHTIMKRDTLWQFWKINYFGKGWMCFHQREYEFHSNPQFHNSTWPRVLSESTKGISIGFWSLKQWRVKSGVIEFQNS